ncbi:Uncharacterised protein [Neisseria zoodegmatis]|uniref:Uncharacterized protein n=1 Tax=Neisseria zoodegmatis TaxID=326523 RepID=A0A378WSR9_9NEIS|nr:hypothetical protein [Neisseria zoodegmatis]SUA44288.1 Uncharacterised protein [Neisseria zoodegmatis]
MSTTLKCKQIELLKTYLRDCGGVGKPIDHAEQFEFSCGLLVNVYNTTTVNFQNLAHSTDLVNKIKNFINQLNSQPSQS